MGKVRSKLVKNTAEEVLKDFPERFSADFEKNKEAVTELLEFPSKRMRNKVAGFVTTLYKKKSKEQ